MIDEKLKNDISSIATNSQELLDRCISSLDEIDRANARAIADIEARTNNLVKSYTNSIKVSVGASGDFTSLKTAINYYSDYRPKLGAGMPQVEITILPDYVIKETFSFKRCNLAHILITSNNEVINVDCADLTYYNIFSFEQCSGMVFYRCNFNFINTTNKNIYCFNANHQSFLYVLECTIKNVSGIIRAYTDTNCDLRKSTFENISNCAVYLSETANTNSIDTTYINCTQCFQAIKLSRLASFNDTFNATTLVAKVSQGGMISLSANTYTGVTTKTSQATNVLTAQGVIYE